jgi:pimeloyl-ACP methyl ester carboxylesterase
VPYNQVGHGPRPLVIFQGLVFENKPLPAQWGWLYSRYYAYLAEAYTTYIVLRKPGMPDGYTLQNMSDDYAAAIKDEVGGAVDVIGVSTGGSIAQHFAAEHPDLVRKLIIHSSAYALSALGKKIQMRVAYLARRHQWRAAYAALVSVSRYPQPVIWLGSLLAGTFGAPKDSSDAVVALEAEDKFNFKDRLAQITAPTLVIAGDEDPFYSPALFRETAEGIPNARLILYKGMGHPASGKQFRQDVLMFLKEA